MRTVADQAQFVVQIVLASTAPARAAIPWPSTRAKPGRPARIATVRARSRGRARVVVIVRDSSSSAFGARSATPWEVSVRQQSTGSPPAPTSASSADQALAIGRLNAGEQESFRANICSMDDATILHADLDAFFAAVEQRDDPR